MNAAITHLETFLDQVPLDLFLQIETSVVHAHGDSYADILNHQAAPSYRTGGRLLSDRFERSPQEGGEVPAVDVLIGSFTRGVVAAG